jgi:hypothetical protein
VFESTFERRLRAALSAPVATDASAKEAIMARVRAAASRPVGFGVHRLSRRGARYSIVGLALAAGLGSITTLSTVLPAMRGEAGTVGRPAVIGDTVVGTLHDTLRLVRLIFDAPTAQRVAVVGDFNGWRAGDASMRRDRLTRRWSATLALRDGAHRYAFVVDGTRWVPDPSVETVRASDGRVYSLLYVARASN